jgi:RNA polymerase sigma-70 factor
VDVEKTAVRIQGRESVAMTTAEFGRLFATWRARFEAIACRYVRSAAVAEDLVSDSFMSFWENRGRIPADANLQAYILIIVRNKCLDWLRAQSLHAKIEQEVYELRRRVLAADIRSLQAFNPEEIFSEEVAAIVRQSLDRLPELTRDVFIARRFEEMSYKEIAEKYGITVRRVEFELEKAVKQLRVALKDYLPVLLMLLSDNILRS